MSDRTAPDGHRFVCAACGKTSATRYGLSGDRSPGWDESCMLNCTLARPATLAETIEHGWKWVAVKPPQEWFEQEALDS